MRAAAVPVIAAAAPSHTPPYMPPPIATAPPAPPTPRPPTNAQPLPGNETHHTSRNPGGMDRHAVSMKIKNAYRRDHTMWQTVEDMVRKWGWREFHQTYHGITTTGKIHLRQNCATCVNTSRWWQFSNGEVRANYNKLICSPCLDYSQDAKPVN